MKFLEQACLKKFQCTLGSLMMASPNDYMYIIFPCLTTYLMQVLKMFFFVQSAKKNSAENIKQKSYSRKQQKSIPKKAYSNIFTMIAEKRTAEKQTAEKHFPEKLIFWITSPWQVCFKKVVFVSDILLRRGKVLEIQERFCKLLGKI